MFTLLDYMQAYGTSEGVKKSWDTREHGSSVEEENVPDERTKHDAYGKDGLRRYKIVMNEGATAITWARSPEEAKAWALKYGQAGVRSVTERPPGPYNEG